MLRTIFLAGLLAGAAAGVLITGLQEVTTQPLLLQAEQFESGAAAGPAPGWDMARTSSTLLVNIITGVGFALLLAAAMTVRGTETDGRRGVLWGLAGFAAFTLAPALGLPPEPPGVAAADLVDRQIWWLAAAACCAVGLWLLVYGKGPWIGALGLLLIALPHIVGAPHAANLAPGPVPAALAARFAAAAIVTSAVFWAVLGWLTATLYRRFE